VVLRATFSAVLLKEDYHRDKSVRLTNNWLRANKRSYSVEVPEIADYSSHQSFLLS
jgi:hypothetical protein